METPTPNPQTLVAMDWDRTDPSIQGVLDFVGGALLSHERTAVKHWRTGEDVPTHRVTFDAKKVRNTEVHGVAFRSGFVSHIE